MGTRGAVEAQGDEHLIVEAEDRVVALGVEVSSVDSGLFEVSLKLNPGVEPARAEAALWTELDKMAQAPLSAPELRRAKNLVRSQLLRGLTTVNGRAQTLPPITVTLRTTGSTR